MASIENAKFARKSQSHPAKNAMWEFVLSLVFLTITETVGSNISEVPQYVKFG